MTRLFSRFIADENGVTAVEYAVIAGVLVAVIATAFSTLGGGITTTIAGVVSSM